MNNIPGLILDEDELGYEGEMILSAWKGFQSRNGPYCSIDSEKPSDGKCQIFVKPEYEEDNWSVETYHVNAFNFLLENQETVKNKILASLLSEYPKLQEIYGYDPEEKEEYMPNVENIEGFKRLLGLSIVHLIEVEKDGFGYVGYEFGCIWDDEHGIGIMTHKDRIIKIGSGDEAFNTYEARQDKNK